MNIEDFTDLDLNPKLKKKYKVITVPEYLVQKCHRHAKKRKELHKNHASQRIYTEESEFIGLLGECGFGIEKNSEVDWTLRLGGDKYDFKFEQAFIDVKSTIKRNGVGIRPGVFHKNTNYIYVMTRCNEKKRTVTLIGWIRGSEIDERIKDIYYEYPDDIYVPISHFKDMKYLDSIIHKININSNKQNYYR